MEYFSLTRQPLARRSQSSSIHTSIPVNFFLFHSYALLVKTDTGVFTGDPLFMLKWKAPHRIVHIPQVGG